MENKKVNQPDDSVVEYQPSSFENFSNFNENDEVYDDEAYEVPNTNMDADDDYVYDEDHTYDNNFEKSHVETNDENQVTHPVNENAETDITRMTANRDDAVTPKNLTPKKKNNTKFFIFGVAGIGVLALGAITAKLMGAFSPAPQQMQQVSEPTSQQQSLQELEQTQFADNPNEPQPKEVTSHMPAIAPTQNTAYAENDNKLYYNDNAVGNAIQANGVLEFDAKATEQAEQTEIAKPKQLSMEEQLMQKPLNQLSNEELVMAYQLVDQQLAKDTDSHFAILARMKELGVQAPVSQLEARQLQREKRIVEETTRMITNKFSTDLQLLAQRMDELNAQQIALSRNITAELSNVMKRIDVDEINARKAKQQQAELTKANQGILKRYRIAQILGGRVWIATENKSPRTYTVGDYIDNDIVITDIDVDKKEVSTNKGTIR